MNYPVRCYGSGCDQLAQFKIAARWSHGPSSELKTYGLACEKCLPHLFISSIERQKTARTLPDELGERPGIYRLVGTWGDRELVRDSEREQGITGQNAGQGVA